MRPVPDIEESMNKCLCTECPTNPDKESLYCARGITKKPIEQVIDYPNCRFGLVMRAKRKGKRVVKVKKLP